MTRPATTISVSRSIAAPPERVWDLVSDLPRMGEWSPENRGGRWLGGAAGPAVGARFRGINRNGWHVWPTVVHVTEAERGVAFAFDVRSTGLPVAHWRYDLEPDGAGGTRVTESWGDRRTKAYALLTAPVTGVLDRSSHVEADMTVTLDRLAATAEGR